MLGGQKIRSLGEEKKKPGVCLRRPASGDPDLCHVWGKKFLIEYGVRSEPDWGERGETEGREPSKKTAHRHRDTSLYKQKECRRGGLGNEARGRGKKRRGRRQLNRPLE